MKAKIAIAAAILAGAVILVGATGNRAAAKAFDDVANDAWYKDSVAYVSENDIMTGVGEKKFDPDGTVTIGMLVTILYRMEGSPATDAAQPFQDVAAGSYYEKAVIWAANAGIVSGYSESIFGPGDPVTREQTSTILCRYTNAKGYDVSAKASLSAYEDEGTISAYAKDAMAWAVQASLIQGMGEQTLAPKGQTTRAQMAAIITRYHGVKWEKKDGTSGDTALPEDPEKEDSKPETPSGDQSNTTGKDNTTGGNQNAGTSGSGSSSEDKTPTDTKTPTLSVSDMSASAGENNVAVTVSVQNNPGILGMVLSVAYDESALTLTDAAIGDAVKDTLNMTKPGEFKSQCRFVWDGEQIQKKDVHDGSIITLKFSVSKNAAAGRYPIDIFFNDGDIVDNDLKQLDFEVVNGSVTLK